MGTTVAGMRSVPVTDRRARAHATGNAGARLAMAGLANDGFDGSLGVSTRAVMTQPPGGATVRRPWPR